MISAFRFIGDAMKSHIVTAILAVLSNENGKSITSEISDAVSVAARTVPVDAVINSSRAALHMSMRSWSDAEIDAAATEAVNSAKAAMAVGKSPDDCIFASFKVGAEWALAHQRESINAAVQRGVSIPGVAGAVLKDAVGVAGAFATGGESAAVATVVGEAAKAVESLAAGAQDGQAPATGTPPAPVPGTTGTTAAQ